MQKYYFTNLQARRFILLKQGLLGKHKFSGKPGVLEFVKQASCLQFDPVDICGKNAEISLHSRVSEFDKSILDELLYKDRLLVDYPDKQLSIILTEHWPYFERIRETARQNGQRFDGLATLEKDALDFIKNNGPVSSAELPVEGQLRWNSAIHWSGSWSGETNAARAVLEQLYSAGELVVFCKKGSRKYYDLASRHIPQEILNAPDPLPDEYEHLKFRVKRRVGALGLLWNKNSAAWLNIQGLLPAVRKEIFQDLIKTGEIMYIEAEGISDGMYCLSSDAPLAEEVLAAPEKNAFKPRMELISPLDCLLWDRKLIQKLFNFSYTWEIYTPENKRKYGAYTLPLLYGENFAGRADIARKANTLLVKNIWLEKVTKNTKKFQSELAKCLKRFAKFNACDDISIVRES
ncbi:MAG: winged helix DNA-binding domain-containing protein [Defluviitaleaceae bacterium]|nr:winged helix DNA-binding domain-containing protein [Defluviitaleaceae bacterium]